MMPLDKCYFGSHLKREHLGRDVTRRYLRHYRGLPLGENDNFHYDIKITRGRPELIIGTLRKIYRSYHVLFENIMLPISTLVYSVGVGIT